MSTISENNKRIAKNTLFLYVRMLLIMGVSLYTSRVVLQVLGVEDFGIYNVVGGVVMMFSFINGAMAQSTQRFLSFELGQKSLDKLSRTFNTSLLIHCCIAVLIFMLAETLGLWFIRNKLTIPIDRMDGALWVYHFSILSFIVSVIRVPYDALIIAYERMQTYAYISIVEVLLKLGIAYVIVFTSYDKLKVYAVLTFFVCFFLCVLYIYYSCRCLPKNRTKFSVEWDYVRNLSSFAGWSLFGTLAWICKSQGVNIVLNMFLGPIVNASYAIATQVNTAINSFVQNFTMAINPQLVKKYAGKEYEELLILIERGTKYSFFLLLLFAIPILVSTEKILIIWLKTVPAYAVIFTQLIIVNSLLESMAMVMGNAISASGKIRAYQLLVGLSILMNLPISWVALKSGFSPSFIFIISISISFVTLIERIILLKKNISGFDISRFLYRSILPVLRVVICLVGILYLFNVIFSLSDMSLFILIPTSMLLTACISFAVGLTRKEFVWTLDLIKSKFKL